MKKQSDSNDAQTPYDDEATEVFAAEGPLDETVGIDERATSQAPRRCLLRMPPHLSI